MTSKERVRATLSKQKPDRVPVDFSISARAKANMFNHYNFNSMDDVYEKFDIDIIEAAPKYIGKKLKDYTDTDGRRVTENFWGFHWKRYETETDSFGVVSVHPLKGVDTLEELEKYTFPNPDDFDYSPIAKMCEKYPDKAIIIGHPGSMQIATELMPTEELYMLMASEPEVAQAIFDGMLEFELEYYKRCFIAGNGKIDILRTHDDFGTQISMLFSEEMWVKFFKNNIKKLCDLSHKYNAFFMQHSCGAVGPLIPHFIDCGVDALDPIQKVTSLYIEDLLKFKGKITFHGGIDTQDILPKGTSEEVSQEVRNYIENLATDGGFILSASQTLQVDIPYKNIEAIYFTSRYV
ncbi:MAG: uroporphyrinogen decarboxylase family protein [Clostridia bacterium]